MKSFRSLLPQTVVLALLCAGLMACPNSTFGQASSGPTGQVFPFAPTGNMTTARTGHTATLLNDGTVLVAGGDTTGKTAELYNPATGTFTATGSMTTARTGHTATVLNDGTVLAVGGDSTHQTAELYNPAMGTFTATGSMTTARTGYTATLLNNGKVLVAGGDTTDGQTAELYDPTTGAFTATGSMANGRTGHTATLLNNGRVLVAGGSYGTSFPAIAELYNPATGSFTVTGSLTIARTGHTATRLNNGTVLVAGGVNGSTVLATAEVYDPTAGTFTPTLIVFFRGFTTGNMTTAREQYTATLLNSSGMVLVAGGFDGNTVQNTAEVWDPVSAAFYAIDNMTTARKQQTATPLVNGAVLVAGGSDGSDPLASAELYDVPAVTFVGGTIIFPKEPTGISSAPQNFHLTNNQSTTLNITSIAITGANASEFTQSNTCGSSLAGASSCTISVIFTPAAIGSRSATLTITDNAPGSPRTASLTGTGIVPVPAASLSPSTLTFTDQPVSTTSASQQATLSNMGFAPLAITSIAVTGTNSGDFAQVNTCGSSVAAGTSCNITVNFTPTATGSRNASLTFMDNATGSPQTVSLSGAGIDFSVAPSSVATATVTPGQTASYALTVAPSGGFNQSVTFVCSGAPASSTCVVSPNMVALNGSASTTVAVTVATTAASLLVHEPPANGTPPIATYPRPTFLISGLLGLALLASLLGRRKQGRPSLAYELTLALLFVAGMTMAACGGGGSTTGGGSGSQATPQGSYTLVVSGTFTSGSNTLTRNTNLTLVVQ